MAKPARSGWSNLTALRGAALLAPCLIFLLIFFVYPLLDVAMASFPAGGFSAYKAVFGSTAYITVMVRTIVASALVTVICLLLAFPYAWAMTRARRGVVVVLAMALFLPFWVSILLRTFSWQVILQDTGIVNQLIMAIGLSDRPFQLMRTSFSVVIGMVHVLLPFAVLPIYSVMRKLNLNLLDAALICGAGPIRTLCRILVPVTMPGIAASAILTFTLSLGFYITPAILGGPRNTMIAQLISSAVGAQRNLPLGAALAMVLLAATIIAFCLLAAFRRVGRHPSARGV